MVKQIEDEVFGIFQEAQDQKTKYQLGKSCQALKKVMVKADQKKFFWSVKQCLMKILSVKKKHVTIERLVKFVSLFVAHLVSASASVTAEQQTSFNEFINSVLRFLAKGIDVNEKSVRLRSCQLLAQTIDCIEELDDDIYEEMRAKLLERVKDKEAAVRAQAVIALSKFQSESAADIQEALVLRLRNDSSTEVRKAALSNIEVNAETVPYIIERIRDTDANIRKYVYLHSFKDIAKVLVSLGQDGLNAFSMEDRERILLWGLNDRDPKVKAACVDMMASVWVDQFCQGDIIKFLEQLNVTESKAAEKCLEELFRIKGEFVGGDVDLSDEFWDNLTPESILLARMYLAQLDSNQDELLPEITKVSEILQNYYDRVMKTRDEAEKNKLQFICGELLRLCLILDYSADEAGRRNLRDILKQLLVRYDLDENAGLIFDVMDKISDLKEFINEVFGLIREWLKIPNEFENDAEDAAVLNEMQNLSLNPTEQFVISIKAMACVTLLLERTEFDLNDYEVFCSTFLTKQVLPSLHSPEPALQLTALMCMIQFCLMNKDLAVDNIDFFLTTLAGECSEEIGAVSIRALFDILLKFGFNQFDDDTKRKIRDLFFNILLDGEDESVRVVVVEGCAKLMLFSQFKDDDIMQRMIELYYDSDNQDSYESSSDTLKQCLSFFFPIYCHTNEENQYFMARVCFKLFFDIGSLPVVEDGTITAQQVQLQMIEWIHPFNIREEARKNFDNHVKSYTKLVLKLVSKASGFPNSIIKLMIQFVTKLPLTDVDSFDKLAMELEDLAEPINDKALLNSIDRMKNSLYEDDEEDDAEENSLNNNTEPAHSVAVTK